MGQRLSFEDWMHAVDRVIVARVVVDSADLPDICYADLYEDGATPASAARQAIRYAQE